MLYARHGRPVFIAVPAYSGLSAGTAFSLFESNADAELAVLEGHPHVDDARNRLVAQFLASRASDLVFIDADVSFEPRYLDRLLSYDRDIVAGVYPKKAGAPGFPVELPPGELWATPDGLLEVLGAPAGFLRIRRPVLEALASQAQTHTYEGLEIPIIFERTFEDGVRWGGDYAFCRKARAAGFAVMVDPEIWLKHGEDRQGSLGQMLRHRHMLGLGHALGRLRGDLVDVTEACQELARYWGNIPYAADAATLIALATIAKRSKRILECGSGISTLVMAAANPDAVIDVLEESPEWAERVSVELRRYGLTPQVRFWVGLDSDGWYQPPPELGPFDFVFVDGPSRFRGLDTRRRVYSDLADEIRDAVAVIDDALDYPDIVARYERKQLAGDRVAICLPNERKKAAA